MDVFFYEAFDEEVEAIQSVVGPEFTFGHTSSTIQEIGHAEPPAGIISIRTQSILPPQWADTLRAVLSRTTGYDHLIQYRSAISNPLPLGYLEAYSTRAVAEHAMMATMALLRGLPKQMRQFPYFDRNGLTGVECLGKNLLVVGVGRIGSEIVKLARGLGFTVKGVDIVTGKHDVEYMERESGVRWADIIVCSMNLTEENKGYFGYDFLKMGKKGLFFVNVARGEHAPLADLDRLLSEGHLAGIALDVFEDEGMVASALRNPKLSPTHLLPIVNRLLMYSNVVLTPHNAFNSQEALRRKAEMSVAQIRQFRETGSFSWQV